MKILIVFLFSQVFGELRDVFIDTYNENRDDTVSPCDNFYRHACRKGITFSSTLGGRIQEIVEEHVEKSSNRNQDSVWLLHKSIDELSDEIVDSIDRNDTSFATKIAEQYSSWCLYGERDSSITSKTLLDGVLNWISNNASRVLKSNSLSCEEKKQIVKTSIIKNKTNLSTKIMQRKVTSAEVMKYMRTYNFFKNGNIQLGAAKIRSLLNELKSLISSRLEKTPWAKHYNVTEEIESYAKKLHVRNPFESLEDRIAITVKEYFKELYSCSIDLTLLPVDVSNVLCYLSTFAYFDDLTKLVSHESGLFFIPNAMNFGNSYLIFYPIFYYLSVAPIQESSFLGNTGFTIGHEFGHTLFEDRYQKPIFSNYSENVRKCVEKQFKSTCEEFKERSCGINEHTLDEIGADVIGYQLAYNLFKAHIGEDKLHDTVPGFPISQQQLFFYSFAQSFCFPGSGSLDDSHPAHNIRINSIVQLPAFQEAFNCPNDSRMMRTRTKECHIYGELAPETRKFASNPMR